MIARSRKHPWLMLKPKKDTRLLKGNTQNLFQAEQGPVKFLTDFLSGVLKSPAKRQAALVPAPLEQGWLSRKVRPPSLQPLLREKTCPQHMGKQSDAPWHQHAN